MSTWQNDRLAEQLAEDSEDLEKCSEDFQHWLERTVSGKEAFADFQALSDKKLPFLADMSMPVYEALFRFVLSQTHTHGAMWQDYYVQSGLEAYEGARIDAMMDAERDNQLEGDN